MNAREIVSLQIGHYSNFVGSHWWNCQEASFIYDPTLAEQFPKEVNHDVLYREGRTIRGEVTYTPRLVLFDLYHSLGSMKREGILYDQTGEEDVRWHGDVTLHQEAAAEKNPFLLDLDKEEEEREGCTKADVDVDGEEIDTTSTKQKDAKTATSVPSGSQPFYQLDDEVKVWSDYLRTSLHAKTVNLIQEHQHDNPEQPFDVFGLGEQLLTNGERMDAMEDRVRFFTEECDHLQGFHIMLDSHNAFGGFASPILSYLADEYPNASRFSMSFTPARPPDQTPRERACRIINSALSLDACSQHSDLHLPLSLASGLWRSLGSPVHLPYLQYQAGLNYHTSAILSAALDTFTMPYRKQEAPFNMCDITNSFSSYGRKVASLKASLPLPLSHKTSIADYLMSLEGHDPWAALTPHLDTKCVYGPTFQSCVVRGFPISGTSLSNHPRWTPEIKGQLSHCSNAEDVLRMYLTETSPSTASAGCVMRDGLPLDTSFPHIFHPSINKHGHLSDVPRHPHTGVESVPLMTSLQSGPQTGGYVTSLVDAASKMNISKHQHFIQAGLDPDDYQDIMQNLMDLGHCYKH